MTTRTRKKAVQCPQPEAFPPAMEASITASESSPGPVRDMADVAHLIEALAAPFDPDEVKWKPGAVSGNRALALCFIDARAVMDRLDVVLGVDNWQDEYQILSDGSVLCKLRIRLGGEWITKMDVGGQSEQPDEGDRCKAAVSDALKRTAVKFGIGRYLYRLPPQWCDYDQQKRQFKVRPTLPAWARPQPQPAAPTPQSPQTSWADSAQIDRIDVLRDDLGWTEADLADALRQRFGILDPRKLTAEQASQVIAGMEQALQKLRVGLGPAAAESDGKGAELASDEQLARIDNLTRDLGWDDERLASSLQKRFGVGRAQDLTTEQASQVIAGLEKTKKPGK